ncbi:hypothetical protein EC575_26820 [Vibrio cholerae]|nr:hypothetical protein [Vibrio cholerae]EGR0484360.1 hypothetical protein [Vibrio cholerae]EGR1042096.1 hypothetical protein [Vibrio cholerae]EGR2435663.1 hypothetical protein [Vibrio cholerae]EGR2517270.1 hypothetical protein [Vibrio cholerae]
MYGEMSRYVIQLLMNGSIMSQDVILICAQITQQENDRIEYVELHSTNPTNEEILCSMLNKKPMWRRSHLFF